MTGKEYAIVFVIALVAVAVSTPLFSGLKSLGKKVGA